MHPQNEPPPIIFTDEGISICANDEHRQNALFPIDVTDGICFDNPHPSNYPLSSKL